MKSTIVDLYLLEHPIKHVYIFYQFYCLKLFFKLFFNILYKKNCIFSVFLNNNLMLKPQDFKLFEGYDEVHPTVYPVNLFSIYEKPTFVNHIDNKNNNDTVR